MTEERWPNGVHITQVREPAPEAAEGSVNGEQDEIPPDWRHICFLVCAVKTPETDEYQNVQFWQTQIVEPVLKGLGYTVIRLDLEDGSGSMLSRILAHLREAFIVIVDISYENINVGYELALRHVVGKHCIAMRFTGGHRAGSDFGHHAHIRYDRSLVLATDAKERLKRRVESLAEHGRDDLNPVNEAQIVLNSADRSAFVNVHDRLNVQAESLARIEAMIRAQVASAIDQNSPAVGPPPEAPTTGLGVGLNDPAEPDAELDIDPASTHGQEVNAEKPSPVRATSGVAGTATSLQDRIREAEEESAHDRPTGVPKRMSDVPGTLGYYSDPMDVARDFLNEWGAELSQTVRNSLLADKDFVMEAARSLGGGNLGPLWRITDAINTDAMSPVMFPLDAVQSLRDQALDPFVALDPGSDAVRYFETVYGSDELAKMAALASSTAADHAHAVEALKLNPQLAADILAGESPLRKSILQDPRMAETIASITRPAWLDDVGVMRPPWESVLPSLADDIFGDMGMGKRRPVKRAQSGQRPPEGPESPEQVIKGRAESNADPDSKGERKEQE